MTAEYDDRSGGGYDLLREVVAGVPSAVGSFLGAFSAVLTQVAAVLAERDRYRLALDRLAADDSLAIAEWDRAVALAGTEYLTHGQVVAINAINAIDPTPATEDNP